MRFGFPRAIPVCAALLWWQAEPEERTMVKVPQLVMAVYLAAVESGVAPDRAVVTAGRFWCREICTKTGTPLSPQVAA